MTRFNPNSFYAASVMPTQMAHFGKSSIKGTKKMMKVAPNPETAVFEETWLDNDDDKKREDSAIERVKAAITLIRSVPRSPEIKYMCNDVVPVDLEGAMPLPIIPKRVLVTRFLKDKSIDEKFLEEFLFDHLGSFMTALAEKDFDKLEKLGEKTFVDQIKERNAEATEQDWFTFK